MQLGDLYEQLKQRRVIRAAVIYAALLWALLQVADLLAGADMIGDAFVRWMIVMGVVGFPLTLIGSWFLESPWNERRWTAVAGDLLIIVGIAVAAFVFVWQQWFQTFARPVVAVLSIEATDTREDTADLADHLTKRLRMLLATRIELKVIETSSSTHPSLTTMSLADKTSVLDAEYVLTGTLSRGGDDIRFSFQLYDRDGELLWGEVFEDRLTDQAQLQNRVLTELWSHLPVDADALAATKQVGADCDYPTDGDAILALAGFAKGGADQASLIGHIEASEDNALLYVEQARARFAALPALPPASRPVAQRLAMQNLAAAGERCPAYPEINLMRLENTRTVEQEGLGAAKHLAKHPNASSLYIKMADGLEDLGASGEAVKLLVEAYTLDPLNPERLCRYRELLDSADNKISTNINAACE